MTRARIVGALIAAPAITVNFLPIPYHPLWSMTLIALYGLIVRGLCVVRRKSLY